MSIAFNPSERHENQIVEFASGYGRIGEVYLRDGVCMKCKRSILVLCADSSEGEYEPARICHRCIEEAFNNFKRV